MKFLDKLKLMGAGRVARMSATFRRWAPLLSVTAYVVTAAMRLLGKVTEADQIDQAIRALGLPTAISEEEITLAVGMAVGLAVKWHRLLQVALGKRPASSDSVLKTEREHEEFIERYNQLRNRGLPFEEARRLALEKTLAKAS